jgi:hypothetical protein
LAELVVGEIPVPEESVLTIALTLVRVFPRIESIDYDDESWEEVLDAIRVSRQLVDCSGEEHSLAVPRGSFIDISPGATPESGS